MADAQIRLHLDPTRVIAGAQAAAGALARIPGAIAPAIAGAQQVAGQFGAIGRAAQASVPSAVGALRQIEEQARRTARAMQAAGRIATPAAPRPAAPPIPTGPIPAVREAARRAAEVQRPPVTPAPPLPAPRVIVPGAAVPREAAPRPTPRVIVPGATPPREVIRPGPTPRPAARIVTPAVPRPAAAPLVRPGVPRPPLVAPRLILPDGTRAAGGLVTALEAGMRRHGSRLGTATTEMMRHVDRRLPHSNAQTGPLSDLSRSGRAIPETLAAGVRAGTGRLNAEVNRMAQGVERRVSQMARAMAAQGIPSARVQGVARAASAALTPEARAAGGFFAVPGPRAPRRAPTGVQAPPAPVASGFVARPGGPPAAVPVTPAAPRPRTPGGAFVAPGGFTRRTGAEAVGGVAAARAAQRSATSEHLAGLRRVRSEVEGVNEAAGRVGRLGGIGRMWALGTAASQVRQLGRGLREAAGFTVDIASERQTAAAELRTVVPETDPRGRAILFDAARQMAAGQTAAGQIAGVTESDFMKAAFAAVASGFTPDQAAQMVPQAAILGIAGQISAQEAQIAIGDAMSIFKDRSTSAISDMFARAQDIGVFPTGAGQMFDAFTKMAGTAQAAGMGMEDALSVIVALSGAGATFRGATGGQKALMAIREMEAGGMEKLGLQTRRDATGGLDVAGNIAALRALGPSVTEVNDAFGKRAGPAILALMGRFEQLDRGLGDFAGTALENAQEHTYTYAATMKRLQARTQLLTSEMGEGAIAARKWGAELATGVLERALRLSERRPGLARGVGFAGQIAGAGVGVAGGALETMVGVHAFSQLLGIERPLGRMFGRLGQGFRLLGTGGGRAFAMLGRGAVAMLPAIVSVGGALWAAAAPILPFVAAAAAVAGAAYLIIRNWEPISGFFRDTWQGMTAEMNRQWDGMFGLFGEFGTVVTFFRGIWDTIAGVFRGGGDELVNEVQSTADKLTAAKAGEFGFDATAEGQGSYGGAEFRASPLAPGSPEAQAAATPGGGLDLLGQFGLSGQATNMAGKAIPETMAQGVQEGGPKLGEQTGLMLDQFVGPKLPGSDAEEGPLSRLTAAGRAIPETLAAGAAQGAAALAGIELPTPAVAAPGGAPGGTDLSEVVAQLRSQNTLLRSIERILEGRDGEREDTARAADLLGVVLAAEAGA